MRRRMIGFMVCLSLSGGMITGINANAMGKAEVIDEENMQLIQEGEILVPSTDYSFDRENIRSYYDENEETSDNEQQLVAQEIRKNNDETLDERKEACAKALYECMTNFKESVVVTEYALSKDEFKDVISNLVNSNPELFYIGQAYGVKSFYLSGNSGTQIVKECMGFYECQSPIRETRTVSGVEREVTIGYTSIDKDKIKNDQQTINDIKDSIISKTITSNMSDVEKAVLLHDYLALHMEYDYEAYLENKANNTNKYEESDYDVYGALVNGKAVCQGYTLAYKYLMEEAGVENVGFASNETHIWNTVTIDGDGYFVDCTWDDPGWDTLGNVKHRYLLKGEKDFKNHGVLEKTDRECKGEAFKNVFWNDINSGIFYENGKFYYINEDGKLCIRDSIDDDADVKVKDFSLTEDENWNYVNAAKIALGNNYVVYHDKKNVYVYNCADDKKKVLLSPKMDGDECIYGLSTDEDVLSYSTRNTDEMKEGLTKQQIYTYELPENPFDIPIKDISIEGPDKLYIRMENGEKVYDKASLAARILPENATDQRIRSWKSSDKNVLLIDINGKIKAVSTGEVKVTVETMSGNKAEKTISVVYDGDIVRDDGVVLHYDDGKLLANRFYTENGKKYYLNSDGVPVKGLQTLFDDTYLFDSDGVMLTGWQTINSGNYYFNNKGIMQKACFLDYGGKRYFLDNNGKMVTGLIGINVNAYLFDENGVMQTGWQDIKGSGMHYFNSNGAMQTGWQEIEGHTYYFNTNGVMLTGWQDIEGNTYYFDEKGVLLTVGWQTIAGKKYYFNMRGVPVKGWQKISDKTYYFDKSGVMLTGWQKIGKKKYYFDKNGVMSTGWKKIKKKKYYFNKKGVMLTGWQKISGKKYYFNKKGVMLKGLQVIKGVSYYFASDGHFIS